MSIGKQTGSKKQKKKTSVFYDKILLALLGLYSLIIKARHKSRKKMKNFSKQKEPIGERVHIAYRPDSVIYKKLETISKKEGISLNQTIDKFIKRGITTGLSF